MNYEAEATPSGVKKLIQVSENIQNPVHVPVVLGNECFIITQQDIRKIEDVRFISYHRLGPNGELIPVQAVMGQELALRDAILNAARFHNQNQVDISSRQLLEMLGRCCGQQPPPAQSTTATIAQQMEWANSCNTSSPAYPFTYTKATSTADIPRRPPLQCCCTQSCCCSCPPKYLTHRACNTVEPDPSTDHIEGPLSARQMLKMRKMMEDQLDI